MIESIFTNFYTFVFAMMMIGFGLTVWEFRYGQPRRDEERAHQSKRKPQQVAVSSAGKINGR